VFLTPVGDNPGRRSSASLISSGLLHLVVALSLYSVRVTLDAVQTHYSATPLYLHAPAEPARADARPKPPMAPPRRMARAMPALPPRVMAPKPVELLAPPPLPAARSQPPPGLSPPPPVAPTPAPPVASRVAPPVSAAGFAAPNPVPAAPPRAAGSAMAAGFAGAGAETVRRESGTTAVSTSPAGFDSPAGGNAPAAARVPTASTGFASAGPPVRSPSRAPAQAGAGFGSASTASSAAPRAAPAPPSGFGAAAAVRPASRPSAVAPSGATTPLEILYKPRPAYTAEARAAKIEGEVALEVLFGAAGGLRVLRVIRPLGYGLEEVALAAAGQIRFRPATEGSRPVDTVAIVRIAFQLAY
jgi:periplasmic protein TonB